MDKDFAHSHRNAAAGAMSEARASEGALATAGQDPSLTFLHLSPVTTSPQGKALFPEDLPAKHTRASFVPLRHSFSHLRQMHPPVSRCPDPT